jgi:putative ABC transport system ATP-binding protein
VLTVTSIEHRYRERAALAATSFELAAGEHCALLGPSGAGKTTLLHILAGFLKPSAGAVTLAGEDLYTPARNDRWRAQRVGVVPQKLHLIAGLAALDNVRLAQMLAGRGDDGAAAALLARLGLADVLHAAPMTLSVGQQQRVAVARAVVNRPRLLLADEPTAALDDASAQTTMDLLFEAARDSGALLVVATHDARVQPRFARVVRLERAP